MTLSQWVLKQKFLQAGSSCRHPANSIKAQKDFNGNFIADLFRKQPVREL